MPFAAQGSSSSSRHATSALVALVATALVLMCAAAGAHASPNSKPSTAIPFAVGVPFTGDWAGTSADHGDWDSLYHWWQAPGTLRPGDHLQIAVDNRQGGYVSFCLAPPIDDFDANATLDACSFSAAVSSGAQERVTLEYSGAPGQGFLVATASEYADGQYALTVEQMVTRVNTGLVVPPQVGQGFQVVAQLRYGDNTPVADGLPVVLEWRYKPARGADAAAFGALQHAVSAGGAATFDAALPAEAQGQAIQLRACATQPGGASLLCSPHADTTVAPAPGPSAACTAAVAKRRARARKVRRLDRRAGKLARRMRRARGRRARRAYRRDVRRVRRKAAKVELRLVRARRAVGRHCR